MTENASTASVSAQKPPTPTRALPDRAIGPWLLAGATVVALTFYVVRNLSGGMHHEMADAMFRGSAPATTQTLLGIRLLTAWQLNAVALALVALAAIGYLAAIRRRSARAVVDPWPLKNTACFMAGLAVIIFATCGSISVYDQALFTAHMLVHLSLVMLAPVLLVLGHPLRLATESVTDAQAQWLRAHAGGPTLSLLTSPPMALALYSVAIVGAHLTGLMDLIMRYTWAGQVERVVYLLVGCLYFAALLGDPPLRWQLSTPVRWMLLAVAMAVDTFTGVVLMMAAAPITMNAPDGVGALSDTHTGGAIMWFGGDGIMAVVMICLAVSWLGQAAYSERDRTSWLEQARTQSLAEGEFAPTDGQPATADLDDDDAEREIYNRWLARISGQPPLQ